MRRINHFLFLETFIPPLNAGFGNRLFKCQKRIANGQTAKNDFQRDKQQKTFRSDMRQKTFSKRQALGNHFQSNKCQ